MNGRWVGRAAIVAALGLILFMVRPVEGLRDATADAPTVVTMDSKDGIALLRSPHAALDAFYSLSQYMVTQKHLTFCGIASAVMYLNAAEIPRPAVAELLPYHFFTQESVFLASSAWPLDITPRLVEAQGLTLSQEAQVLQAFRPAIDALAVPIKATSDCVKHLPAVVTSLSQGQAQAGVIVNYHRSALGQEGGGHFSPLGGVVEVPSGESYFLILDVSRYKYQPVWVRSDILCQAVSYVEGRDDPDHLRGFLLVHKATDL